MSPPGGVAGGVLPAAGADWLVEVRGSEVLGLVVLLLAGCAFFAGSETAVVSARRSLLVRLAQEGRHKARAALALLEDTPHTIATTLVGTNLCNIAAISLATSVATRISPGHGALLVTVVLTPIVLVGTEILPKAFFRVRPTRLLLLSAGALRICAFVFAPLVTFASGATRVILLALRIPPGRRRPLFRRRDLESLFLHAPLHGGRGRGGREPGQALRMAGRALGLGRRKVAEVMAPLPAARMCAVGGTVADAKERFRAGEASFLAAVDERDRVEGFLTPKALLGEDEDRPLAALLRPAYLLDPEDRLDEVIRAFREHQQWIGLVRGRDGRTLGVITAEDVFAEVVGELARDPDGGRPRGGAPGRQR